MRERSCCRILQVPLQSAAGFSQAEASPVVSSALAAKHRTPPARRWPRHALLIAALWAAALAAYSNSFHAGLVFDSQRVILADSRIQADTPENTHLIWTGDYYNGTGSGAL